MKSHQWQNAALRWISLAAAALLGLSLFTVGRTVLAEESTEGVFQYQITQEGAEITGYTGTDSNVTLPSQLGGYPVTGIGERAFAFNQELEEITLPDTLAYIQDSAFLLCRNLSRVNFFDPPELLQAGEGILRDTAWWEVQPEGLVLLGNTALGWKGQAPATLVLDSTVTAVADQAFSSNYLPQTGSLTRVEVGDSVQLLGAQAFAGQGSLTRIFISDSVVSLGEGLLIDCSGELVLETYIGSAAEAYAAEWGILCEAVCHHNYQWVYQPQPVLGQSSAGVLFCQNCGDTLDQITFLTGDLTGEEKMPDGTIDLLDVMQLAQWLAEDAQTGGIFLDYRQDGAVDVLDVMELSQYVSADL